MTRRPMCLVCLVLTVCLFFWQKWQDPYDPPLPKETAALYENGAPAVVRGEVQRQTQNQTTISIDLSNTYLICEASSQSISYPIQNLRVFWKKEIKARPGDILTLKGELSPVPGRKNPGEFDTRSYYAAQKLFYFFYGEEILESQKARYPFSRWRQALWEFLREVLERVAAGDGGILTAMLLGDKSQVEDPVKDYYQMAGMLHLLAISGLHLSFLGLGCVRVLLAVGAGSRLAYGLSALLMCGYGFLIHGGPSTWRAILMFAVTAGARLLGRSYDMLSAFALAAVVLLLLNPAYLGYSGFLLSFGAVLGLGLAGELAEDKRTVHKKGAVAAGIRYLRNSLRASLWVQGVTLPLVLAFYYEFSLFGFFWNLLVLPAAGLVLGFGMLGLVMGCLWTPLGQLCILPARGILEGYLLGARAGAGLPYCTWIAGEPEPEKIAVYYGVLLLLCICWKKKKIRFGLLAGLVVVIASFGVHPRNGLAITCLSVGQGDCIVWECQTGETFLVDGGSSSQSEIGRYQLIPYLKSKGIARLDGIFVSHPDVDHISGIIELLKAMAAHTTAIRGEVLFLPRWEAEVPACEELKALAHAAGMQISYLRRGQILQISQASVRVLHPEVWTDSEDLNGGSLVLELTYQQFRGLFPGDLGEKQEKELLAELRPCQFLKVAHHGSRYATSTAFLEKVRPRIAFLSYGEKNRYGHPSPDTKRRLWEAGTACADTEEGAVTLWTDGERYAIYGFTEE